MKKRIVGTLFLLALCLGACGQFAETSGGSGKKNFFELKITKGAETDVPEVTETPAVTESPEGTEDPTATELPEGTMSPDVTETPEATEVPEPTSVPTVTKEPKPTVTPTPTTKPTPTVTPKPSKTSELQQLLKRGTVHKNTTIRGTVCTSEKEANEYVRTMTLTYSGFSVIVDDVAKLHSAEEYMELYPEIIRMEIEKIDTYSNGYCMVFTEVQTVYDANLCYAMRTGNFSVLSDTERQIYEYVKDVVEATGAKNLARVEAVRALHDYLVLQLKYDTSFRQISHSPEGVIQNKMAVCDGYARTMRLLLLTAGIECEIVTGTSKGESHAWNLVKMEDGWYHVDVTWDDPIPDVEGKVSYLYFLKNDSYMAKDHVWEHRISCTKDTYQLYMYRDVICDSAETMKDVYTQQVTTKKNITFCYPKTGEVNQGLILDYVMKQLQQGLTYYPEKEVGDYYLLEIENPLFGE